MAEANISVDESHFRCPICLEILKDPVTIPCGHSYCMECIKNCWDQDEEKGVYSCPQCRKTFDPRPVLGRNLILADMVNKLKAQGHQSTHLDEGFAGPGDVECTVCIGGKRKAEKSCLDCFDSYCEIHLCHHEELHLGKKHKVVEAVSQLQQKLCPEHSKPLEAFCQTDSKCLCVACIVDDEHKDHNIISPAKAKEENQRNLESSLQSEISERQAEVNNLRIHANSLKNSADGLVKTTDERFTELLAFIEQKRSEVVEMIRAQEKAELSRAEQLQEEINVLQKRAEEMPLLASKGDDIHFLQNLSCFSPEDLPRFVCNGKYSFEEFPVTSCLEKLTEDVKNISKENVGNIWRHVKFGFSKCYTMSRKQLRRWSCSPKLDRYTAFRHHCLSEDYTKVKWSHEVVCRGRGWKRFTDCRQVLCSDHLPERAYWEVEWENESFYETAIALAYGDIKTEGYGDDCRFGRNEKSWSFEHCQSRLSFFHNNIETEISGPVPSRVGVYVDQETGILSFYSIKNPDSKYGEAEFIFCVQARFTNPIIPGFYVTSGCHVKIY